MRNAKSKSSDPSLTGPRSTVRRNLGPALVLLAAAMLSTGCQRAAPAPQTSVDPKEPLNCDTYVAHAWALEALIVQAKISRTPIDAHNVNEGLADDCHMRRLDPSRTGGPR